MNNFFKTLIVVSCIIVPTLQGHNPILSLDVISYEDFVKEDSHALDILKKALYEKGIVGIRGIPHYQERVQNYIKAARNFHALSEEIKEQYAPSDGQLGYTKGKEKFKRPDGTWVIDNLKSSYYALVPDNVLNRWPTEVDIQTPFEELGTLMSHVGKAVMEKIGLIGSKTGINIHTVPNVGRMLYYCKNGESESTNPQWCGAHFDHGMFTALIPAYYFVNGENIPEPEEAGLFVKTSDDGVFKKVVANDPNVLLFQVGEFAQLATHDATRATEHYVHKASGPVERYSMALFFSPSMETVIHSYSTLTQDARYGAAPGEPCSFRHWHEESLKRYAVKKEETTLSTGNESL